VANSNRKQVPLENDPLWYKDAIIYELHVRAFADSNGDGIGDFRGLASKLDYLQDLGVTALWLLPFCPSPLRDDGYDIADYTDVHPDYGTLQDVKVVLREAHRRGMRVITELVLNHTSDQHQWYQRARTAQRGSRARDFYVWSDTLDRYSEARIIFKDFETSNWSWDPVAKAYFWHRFYAHQPDLNYESPHVRRAMFKVLDFWLDLGVDGLRLDAVPYLYERDGTNCENLAETHQFLKDLRRHVQSKYENRMLLAEANQWPEDAAAYFGDGDECHVAFHFPLMPRLFMATRLEQRFPIVEILQQTPAIPDNAQWAVFLRNHDELTLEMVTDEERDYMYRVYAGDPRMRINLGIRRRLAPLLGNNRRKMELLNGLLFSMPGTPVLYYGDEIGMGDNIYLGDRNGVRTPMQWSADRNAGFSRANPQRLYLPVIIDPEFHYEALNVEAQQNNPSSMLWWMRRIIGLRKRYKAFGRGNVEFLDPENRKILAFLRAYEDETILIVANLSRFTQCAELDLSRFGGRVPVELFGQTRFPKIGELPYFVTLGPHTFYWFLLEPAKSDVALVAAPALPEVEVESAWTDALEPGSRLAERIERALPAYLERRRWFGGKAHVVQDSRFSELIPLGSDACIVFVRVDYSDMEPETYALPLVLVPGRGVEDPGALAVVRVRNGRGPSEGVLCDAASDAGFSRLLLDSMLRRRRFRGLSGEVVAAASRSILREPRDMEGLEPSPLRAEQSNSSLRYGNQLILKLFRRVEAGLNPEFEIGRHLTERAPFPHVAPLAGSIEYRNPKGEKTTLAILQTFVPNEGDAWSYTLESLDRYSERILALPEDVEPEAPRTLAMLLEAPVPESVREIVGTYWQTAQLLGERTAQMHVALANSKDDPDFAPEPFTTLYQRSIYQSMRSAAIQSLQLLRRRVATVPEAVRPTATELLERQTEVLHRFESLKARRLGGVRIRCHGDYHLGQVLHTGKDFVIIDFEGEPAHSRGERRLKRSPLRDVAGMLRSFHYAASSLLVKGAADDGHAHGLSPERMARLEAWVRYWSAWSSAAFLRSYVPIAGEAGLLPRNDEDLEAVLGVYLLNKALYELSYELNNRPDWVGIPLRGIAQLVGSAAPAPAES